jgi:tryptophan halogenase
MPPSHFVIVGGGTAGWLTAYIIQDCARRAGLDLRLSVVESSKIPTVGVGEASTAALRVFFKHFGIDEFEFFRETGGTFKLGIRHHNWRRKGHVYYGPIDDPHQVVQAPAGASSDYLNIYCVAAGRKVQDMHLFGPLLERRKAPYAQKADGTLVPLGPFHYAFHFDQALLGQFLKRKAKDVEIVDAVVAGVERNPDNGDISALITDDGERLAADFFIDATGFRKRIIVQELSAPWISYQRELPVNRALPFWLDVKEGEEINNYTHAWAQDAGWIWQIPTQTRYGCGYVYSDEFCSPDEAKLEVERLLGRPIEVRSDIRFQIGRLATPWMHNCLAVGLSSSFLEPLESTSIHGTIVQMMLFGSRFLKHPRDMTESDRDDYNARVGRQVDDFRTFVNMHYMTERDDTPFWREVTAHRLHPETRARLAYWQTVMPKHDHFVDFLDGLPHIETQLYYPVLDGLGILDRGLAKEEMARAPQVRAFARKTVDGLVTEYKQAATKAMGHAEFLAYVRENR